MVVVATLELLRRLPRSACDVRRLLVLRAILHHVRGLDRCARIGSDTIAALRARRNAAARQIPRKRACHMFAVTTNYC